MKVFFELLYNFSILVSISIISGFIGYLGKKDWQRALVQGVLFGSASVLGMLYPLVVAPGLIFDGRSVMISLAGFFYGPLAVTVAGAMALILRVQQGGVGALTGVLVIISSALIGLVFYLRYKKDDGEATLSHLLSMGVTVHAIMILLMLTLPANKGLITIKLIGLPIFILYPLATAFIGKIISALIARRRTLEALQESEKRLTASNQELSVAIGEVVAIEEELRCRFDELQINSELLRQSKKEFQATFEQAAVGICHVGLDGRFIQVNRKLCEILDYTKSQLLQLTFNAITYKADLEVSITNQSRLIKGEINSFSMENCYIKGNGSLLWVNITVSMVRDSSSDNSYFISVFEDISERKIMEQKLEYLSYHDQLTGLYNRRFFEEELKRLDVERNFPLTIVMADVNGLKLINDTFGHFVGDELLKRVADAMTKGCRADEIIARLGGDEFVILLPKVDGNGAEQIIKRIKAETSKEKVGSLDISISFGWEIKHNAEQKIQDIFKKAEDRMYQKKLFESPSIRGKTINAIINTLHEKNKREEQHSHRVSTICQSIGEAVGLTEGELEELKTVGLLHDIGKIAIEEKILNKPGKLTDAEWEEIKRHPEIGYRILNTVNDMSEMAEYVLAHHERWDGRGYPIGLKEDEIPIQSRIIAIADSFDAMTSARSYRNALSEKVAIEELQNNAGSQFDPELVRMFVDSVLKKP